MLFNFDTNVYKFTGLLVADCIATIYLKNLHLYIIQTLNIKLLALNQLVNS